MLPSYGRFSLWCITSTVDDPLPFLLIRQFRDDGEGGYRPLLKFLKCLNNTVKHIKEIVQSRHFPLVDLLLLTNANIFLPKHYPD